MEQYQPKYDPERSRQVAAAIATNQIPFLKWPSLEESAETVDIYQRLQSVGQEQIEKDFDRVFYHIFYSSRNRDRDQPMLEDRLGLKDGRIHTLLEVTDKFGFMGPAVTQNIQDDLLRKLRNYPNVDIIKELVK